MSPPRKKQKLRGQDGRFIKSTPKPSQPTQQYAPPKGTATQRLLATPELLEHILQHLPMRDLLLSQRVSKPWLGLLNRSITLRRALFLEPVACGTISYLDWRYDDKDMFPASLNLGQHIRGFKRRSRPRVYARHWGKERADAGRWRVFVNPLLAKLFPVLRADSVYWREVELDLPIAARRPGASWRRMFFTQPPVENLVVEWDCGEDEEGSEDEGGDKGDEEGDEHEDAAETEMTLPAAGSVGPWTSGLPSTNAGAGAAVGNAASGGGEDAEWAVSCFSKLSETKGMTMGDLFYRLEDIGCPAWIEGRDLWEGYGGVEGLKAVTIGKG